MYYVVSFSPKNDAKLQHISDIYKKVGLYGTIFDEFRVFVYKIGYIGTKTDKIGFRHTTKTDIKGIFFDCK